MNQRRIDGLLEVLKDIAEAESLLRDAGMMVFNAKCKLFSLLGREEFEKNKNNDFLNLTKKYLKEKNIECLKK